MRPRFNHRLLVTLFTSFAFIALAAPFASTQSIGNNILGDTGVENATQPPAGLWPGMMSYRYQTDSIGKADGPKITKAALRRFASAVNDYVVLRHRLERSLPSLKVSSDYHEIDKAVRARAAAVRVARSTAREGDIFTPDLSAIFRASIAQGLHMGGHDVDALVEKLHRAIPLDAGRPMVNGGFEWSVWGRATPPIILNVLPSLPEDLQFKFVYRALVLVDIRADLIVDIMPDAL
jgi:hypothetical protein